MIARVGHVMLLTWEHDGRILLARVDVYRWQANRLLAVNDSGGFPLVPGSGDSLLVAWRDGKRL